MVLPETKVNTEMEVKKRTPSESAIKTQNLDFYYTPGVKTLKDINMSVSPHRITAFIGPSGCGKSTLLRCFNRMNDLIPGTKLEGKVIVEGEDIYRNGIRLEDLRNKIGMVFQKSNPFPMSVRENVAFGPRVNGINNKTDLEGIVESALKQADLWREVSDRLNESALDLSGGQQQRLCIARALANKPDIILMDEPASALDPISTGKIEELIIELKKLYTIVIVTHNMQQAARVSDFTAFFYIGELIEFGKTNKIFTNPDKKQTEDYVRGRFG